LIGGKMKKSFEELRREALESHEGRPPDDEWREKQKQKREEDEPADEENEDSEEHD
jgi:hypothetical protein